MRILTTILFFIAFQLFAQSTIKPLVSVGYHYSALAFLGDRVPFNELEIGVGAEFNQFISAQINLRGSRVRYSNVSNKFGIAILSIEPSYRILGDKFMFSPVIAYDAGMEIANNYKDQFMDASYFYSSYYDYGFKLYDKGLYFGKAKLLLSFQWKGLDVLFGATYSTYYFRFKNLTPDYPTLNDPTLENKYFVDGTRVDKQFGFGFETSLKYTFPMKKRSLDKLENRNKKAIE